MNYPHIAARLFSRPQMIHEGKLQAIMSWLSPRMGLESSPRIAAEMVEHRAEESESEMRGNIAVINVGGTLVARGAGADGFSGLTSYEWIGRMINAAIEDPAVSGVMLRFDSYGGEVSGAFDCADAVARCAAAKPTWAAVDDNCYSAAYLLASQCSRIVSTRTGGLGSIGVIAVHVDQSGYDAKMGVKFNAIYAGAHKNDFTPHAPLDEGPMKWLRGEVERDYEMFAEYVARGRGMSVDAVKATEAGLFTGSDAVVAGLADEILTFDEAITRLASEVSDIGGSAASKPLIGGVMSTAVAAEAPVVTASPEPGGKKETGMDERARIAAILNSPEAKGREELARAIAFDTDMDAAAAAKVMAKAAKETPAVNPLATAMSQVENPAVGVGAVAPSGEDDSAAIALILGKAGK